MRMAHEPRGQSRQQILKVMPEMIVSDLKVLWVTATPDWAQQSHTERCDLPQQREKAGETSSNPSCKSPVNVVSWANGSCLRTQVLETGCSVLC